MDIEVAIKGGLDCVALKGHLDAHSATKLLETLETMIDEGRVNILVDMADVTFISSYGLGILATMLKSAQGKNGIIKLSNLRPAVESVFKVTGLMPKFHLFDNNQDALKSFK